MNKIFGILLFLFSFSVQAQDVNWVTFEELPKLTYKEAKPILIFIHTDWCKFCLMQEENTFSDSVVVKELNEHYYCIKLDAESDKTISFLNREYSKTGNSHTLSWVLGAQNNELSYPTTVTLSPQFQITNRWVGYLSKEDIYRMN
ncbi:MAG: hypothetical protein CMP61_06495 [Flavobacteriales bacterium]|nr:hypothetical protein [Flavobacteriales bacterium]